MNSLPNLLEENNIGAKPNEVTHDINLSEHLIEHGPDKLNGHVPLTGIELNIVHGPGPACLDSSMGLGIKNNTEIFGPPLEGHSQQIRTRFFDHKEERQFAQFQEELFSSTTERKKRRVKSKKGSDHKIPTIIGD
ncbi:hypothetical protein L6452_22887 [Arctium lappa]|uniref:Uncharacterized protein n=1 Tax=Arctium lappa TaxID=4217 RepID=A0ACB9B1U8_ARCLA|nr:hypothetical protein L6452_22887 [Arctium lappa]